MFRLEVDRISRDFEDPNTERAALRNEPFVAEVCLSQAQDIPLSLEVSRGKIEGDSLGLSTQYRTAYLIIDMMLVTASEKEFQLSRGGLETVMKITGPNQVKTDAYGIVPEANLSSSISPKRFSVWPAIREKRMEGTRMARFYHGKTIGYFERFLPKGSMVATYAVNLQAALKEGEQKNSYEEVVEAIDAPNKFGSYELHELTITDVK